MGERTTVGGAPFPLANGRKQADGEYLTKSASSAFSDSERPANGRRRVAWLENPEAPE
jgi:hypothetical protein